MKHLSRSSQFIWFEFALFCHFVGCLLFIFLFGTVLHSLPLEVQSCLELPKIFVVDVLHNLSNSLLKELKNSF